MATRTLVPPAPSTSHGPDNQLLEKMGLPAGGEVEMNALETQAGLSDGHDAFADPVQVHATLDEQALERGVPLGSVHDSTEAAPGRVDPALTDPVNPTMDNPRVSVCILALAATPTPLLPFTLLPDMAMLLCHRQRGTSRR